MNRLRQPGRGDRVAQIGNLLFPPTGSRRGIRATQQAASLRYVGCGFGHRVHAWLS